MQHGTESPCFSAGTFAGEIDIPQESRPPHVGVGPALFASRLFIPVCKWLFFEILGYKAFVKLFFSWLFRLIILYFSCNNSLNLREGKCSSPLLHCHLGSPVVLVLKSEYYPAPEENIWPPECFRFWSQFLLPQLLQIIITSLWMKSIRLNSKYNLV